MNKDLATLKRHLVGALKVINDLTNDEKSSNDIKEHSSSSCKNADRLAKQGHPDTGNSVEVAAFDSGDKPRR